MSVTPRALYCYRFHSRWDVPAPPPEVRAVLERVEDYPRWWPQVRAAWRLDERRGELRIRSLLPYDLLVTLEEQRRDPVAGVLEVSLGGDMTGWARWTLAGGVTGTHVHYDQAVEVTKPLLRLLAVPGRPLFRLNHALMMRAGRRGLVAFVRAV